MKIGFQIVTFFVSAFALASTSAAIESCNGNEWDDQVAYDDFDTNGNDGSWNAMVVDTFGTYGEFLGPYGQGQAQTFKAFPNIPQDAAYLTLKFKFYQIDSWHSDDYILLKIANQEVRVDGFATPKSYTEHNGITVSRLISVDGQPIAFGEATDTIHDLTVTIPASLYSTGSITIGFEVCLHASITEQSGGMDDIELLAHMVCPTVSPTPPPTTGATDPQGCANDFEVTFEDFETSDGSWVPLPEDSGSFGSYGMFLGQFKKNFKISEKTYVVPTDAHSLTLQFALFEIDQWETSDFVRVSINDVPLLMTGFETSETDANNEQTIEDTTGMTLSRVKVSDASSMGFNADKTDQVHDVTITIPQSFYKFTGTLKVQFFFQLDQGKNNESGGIDNLRLTAHETCQVPDNCPDDPDKTEPGTCGCGEPDADSDLDGTLDCNDNCPNDNSKLDAGQCGCGIPDTDSDGDGVADCLETTSDGGASGDPHFKTWAGEKYDFHGVCDLVLLQNPSFHNGEGMHVQIRTKKTRQWSYISSAALRIGGETLEVMGSKGKTQFWVNGDTGNEDLNESQMLETSIAGFPISFRQVNSKQKEFSVDIGDNQVIVFQTWLDFVRVDIHGAKSKDFIDSYGLMGTFRNGTKVARDHVTVMDDVNEFGQEWQVLPSEPMLFHAYANPQAPTPCMNPSTTDMRRRLGESTVTQEDAEIACSRVNEADRALCIFDVMAMSDLRVAGAY